MPGSQTMQGMVAVGAVMDVVLALVALIMLWILLRLADAATKRGQRKHDAGDVDSLAARWGVVVRRIESEPLPAAVYHGARWLGGCIVLGMLMG